MIKLILKEGHLIMGWKRYDREKFFIVSINPLAYSLWVLSPVFLWRALCESLKHVLVFEKGVLWISQVQQRQKRLHAPAALQVLQETRAALYMLVNLSVDAALKFAHICNEILSCLKTYLTRVHIDNKCNTAIHTETQVYITCYRHLKALFWCRCEWDFGTDLIMWNLLHAINFPVTDLVHTETMERCVWYTSGEQKILEFTESENLKNKISS